MIAKEKGKYVLRSKRSRKVLGKFATREQAEKRERQVQFFKRNTREAA